MHGVLKCRVPWAFPDSDYTQAFEVRVAYAAAKMPTNLVSREYRIKWGTVGSCVRRVQKNVCPVDNRFRKLKRIAIDETSYQKGYKYITVVQDLETSEIIWAFDGLGDEILKLFLNLSPPNNAPELSLSSRTAQDGLRGRWRNIARTPCGA